ncbi:MAG: hypothetical protein M5U26_19570 [Planctomycetota bacterium]|nr:hypothetical protein [Planctomycetota bacterium]
MASEQAFSARHRCHPPKAPRAEPILARGEQPAVSARRLHFGGDPNLVKLDIRVLRSVKRSA